MDFELPEDIRLLRDTVRKFVDRELIPIEMDSMDGPDLKPEVQKSLEAKARELGLWQLDTPAEFACLGFEGLLNLGLEVRPVHAVHFDRDQFTVDEFPHRVPQQPDVLRQLEVHTTLPIAPHARLCCFHLSA